MQTINKILFNPAGSLSFDVQAEQDLNLFIFMNGSQCDLKIRLTQETAESHLSVVYLSDQAHENKLTCRMEHLVGKTKSNQLIKGVATGKTKGIFEGIIYIAPDAQKCEGYQKHAAVLLSEEAQVRCVPELNIYADDVMCSHGSAVGSLDEEQLFYLKARGIPEIKAKEMLLKGFLSENMPDEAEPLLIKWMNEYV